MRSIHLSKQFTLSWLVAFMAISPYFSSAQTHRLSFHHLTPESGLSQGSNHFIYHDSRGFVWLSSIDGLNRFDGQQVKIYKAIAGDSTSLLGNNVTSTFFEDAQSNIWFTTHEGIHRYNRVQDNFEHFYVKNETAQPIDKGYYAFHLDDQQQLWVRTGLDDIGRLYVFNIEQQTGRFICPIDGHRNFPILNEQGEVVQVASSLFNTKLGIEVIDVKAPHAVHSYFDQATTDAQLSLHINVDTDTLWYVSMQRGLYLFNPKTAQYTAFSDYEGTDIGNVLSSISINDSTLLVSTARQNVLVFDKNKKIFTGKIPLEREQEVGLHVNVVRSFYLDHEDNIWMSSASEGVDYANLQKRKFALPEAFVGRNVSTLFQSSQGTVFCNYKADSLAVFQKGGTDFQRLPVQRPNGIWRRQIEYLLEDTEGTIWGIAANQLLRLDEERFRFNYVQSIPGYILYAYKTPSGRILLSTYEQGIFELRTNTDTISIDAFTALGEYQEQEATTIFEDRSGRLYLALDASRLVVLEQQGGQYQVVKIIENIGYAKAFQEQEEQIWVATTTGLLRINSTTLVDTIEKEAPNEYYYSILPDKLGNFWLSCNRGIIAYNPTTKAHHRYTLSDGIQSNEFNTNAYLQTQNGEIWMGGTKGLNRFYPELVQSISHAPDVQFTQLFINDELQELINEEKQIGITESLVLPYRQNTISLEFVALEYSDPQNNRFQYRLENYDADWISAGKNGFARYANLPKGHYTFQVKAANSDGIWSTTPKKLSLHILTPWWQSWWFYVLCILTVGSIVYGIFMYRLQQALKVERMRVRISSDLHDDVGSMLSGLAMQSELLELTAPAEQKPKLQRISELSRSAMSRMRDTVWAIDARKDKLENLLDRIREHAAETLLAKDIRFELTTEGLAMDKNMSSQIRQNLYLICKEAITNAAKHSTGDQMHIQFQKQGNNGLKMHLQDNGQVAEKEYKTTGLGLSNIRMRAEQIGATLNVDTTDGFAVKIVLPRF